MKVLLYSLNYASEPVGIGKYSGDMATWLAARGHHVRVITAPPYFPEWLARGNRYRRTHAAAAPGQLCAQLHIQDFELDAAFELGLLKGKRLHRLANWVELETIRPSGHQERARNPYLEELAISPQAVVLRYSGSMNTKQGLDQLADIHLLPQRAGAADLVLPSKLLGILASGRPVVASSPAGSELGQLAEQAGLRVEPEDPAAFAGAVRALVADGELRHRLGRQARRPVEQRFGQEAVLCELERVMAADRRADQEVSSEVW